MATAGSIIRRALRLINVLAAGEVASAEDEADSLEALNDMLDAWRNESLTVYQLQDEAFSVTGAASYTIGTGGIFNTVRPVKIERAFIRQSGIDYPIEPVSAKRWMEIADKSTASDYPDLLYYEPAMPLGRIYLYPKPAAGSLHLITWVPLTEFAAAAAAVSLPPGYREAITHSLATRLAPEYGKQVPPSVLAIAADAKLDLKRMNFRAPAMDTGLGSGRRYNVFSDC